MAISFDPAQIISNAVTDSLGCSVLMGMPTKESPVPNFCLLAISDEASELSSQLSGAITQAGEFNVRTIIKPSTTRFTARISEDDTSSSTVRTIQTILSSIAQLSNSVASFGAVLPNLAGVTTGFMNAQVASLNAIKNNKQPVMLLGSYFTLNSLQQQTPYLTSKWYLERISPQHQGLERGAVFQLELREALERRDTSTLKGSLKVLAGELVSPLAGQVAGTLF